MKRLRITVITAVPLWAVIAANYFLYANPPATEPLASANTVSPGIAAAVVSGELLPASELLLVHTQTRPLFSPTRRKWVAPAEQAPAAPEPISQPVPVEPLPLPQPPVAETTPPDVRLVGIEKTPSGDKALLLKTGAADALWLKRGEKLEGWAVQMIDTGSVEMSLGERKIKLELYPPLPSPAAGLDP